MTYIYLASPYSHKEKVIMTQREREITVIAGKLFAQKRATAIFCPITQSAPITRVTKTLLGCWQTWQVNDLAFIDSCTELWIATMPGWLESVGVQAELEYAKQLGKPIKLLDPDTLELTELECV